MELKNIPHGEEALAPPQNKEYSRPSRKKSANAPTDSDS